MSDPLRELLRDDTQFMGPYRTLTEQMDGLRTKGNAIAGPARSLAADCKQLASKPPATFASVTAGLELVRAIRLGDRKLDALDWDAAAQTYYALRAANRSRDRVSEQQPRPTDDIDAALDELAKLLKLPRGVTENGQTFDVNSPVDYDPAKVAAVLKRFPGLFDGWYAKAGLTENR